MESSPVFRKAFLDAAYHGHTLLLRKLVSLAVSSMGEGRGKRACAAQKSPQGYNALHMAALGGNTASCRFLVEDLNFDINSTNHKGQTPLFLAAHGGHRSTVKYLIQKGADVSRSDSIGSTPLHYAAGAGSKEIVTLLISKGADIHTNSHKSPLMMAMLGESVECMELLLKAGSDPNDDCSGSQVPPLYFAVAQQYDVDMIRCLLNAGADPDKTTPWGATALEHAVVCGRFEVVQLLFPVTSCIPCYPDWSMNGIIRELLSQEESMPPVKEAGRLAKAKGKESFERKNYVNAMFWYSMAILVDPSDAKSLSNRSLCYALLSEGKAALEDAQTCVRLVPSWAKAHYREGAAWKVLRDYEKAVASFARALALEPGNKEIESAYRDALAERFKALEVSH